MRSILCYFFYILRYSNKNNGRVWMAAASWHNSRTQASATVWFIAGLMACRNATTQLASSFACHMLMKV